MGTHQCRVKNMMSAMIPIMIRIPQHRAPHGSFMSTLLDETVQTITAITPTFLTSDAQHIELADEVAEDDCTVAGHFGRLTCLSFVSGLYSKQFIMDPAALNPSPAS